MKASFFTPAFTSAFTSATAMLVASLMFALPAHAGDETKAKDMAPEMAPEITKAKETTATDTGQDTAQSSETETAFPEATEETLKKGKKIYKKNCRQCHGNKAQGVASYVKLNHQEPSYLKERLEAYRAGEKIGPNTMLMAPRARKLDDDDIIHVIHFIKTFDKSK